MPVNTPPDVVSTPNVVPPKEGEEIACSDEEHLLLSRPLSSARDTQISEVEQPLGDTQVGSAEIALNVSIATLHSRANAETDTTTVAGDNDLVNKISRLSDENLSLQTAELAHPVKDLSRFSDLSRQESLTQLDLENDIPD